MVLIRRNTLRYCALRGLSAVNNRFGFPGLRRFAANTGYINIDYFNSENETAADGRRLHFDITLRGQAGRARRRASPNSPTSPEPNSQTAAGTGTADTTTMFEVEDIEETERSAVQPPACDVGPGPVA